MKILGVVLSDTLVIIIRREHESNITYLKSKYYLLLVRVLIIILKILKALLLKIAKSLKKCFRLLGTTFN